ncbi:sensor histidine kinase [Enterococcus casseliflavus]|uniref:sensor histidine kinase n=1 Tax=Enterococcus casseliflavus TaxID=37734 RepID=UPI0039A42246
MLKKLRNKMLWFNMALISIIVLGAFTFIYILNATQIEKEIQSLVSQESNILAAAPLDDEEVRQSLTNPEYPMILTVINSTSDVREIGLVDSDHVDVETQSDDEGVDESELYAVLVDTATKQGEVPNELKQNDRYWRYSLSLVDSFSHYSINHDAIGEYSTSINNYEPFYQVLFFDVTDYKTSLRNLRNTLLLIGVLALVSIYIASFYVANRALRPVELAWRKQKEFVSNASHELKTPLAIIQVNAEVLAGSPEETLESQMKWLENIQLGSERMDELVNSLLMLTKFESTEQEVVRSVIDASQVVQSVYQSMEAIALEKGIHYQEQIAKQVRLESNEQALRQLTMILVDNALKYTPTGETVTVALVERQRKTVLQVSNSGCPIPEEKIPYVFDRFYRGDPSRNHQDGGYGLGLAIAKAIADMINADISAKVDLDGKNNFEIYFHSKN